MKKLSLAFAILSLFAMSFAGFGGPDSFGYKWIDSDEPGGPTFNWIDIKHLSGTVNLHFSDDAYRVVTMSHTFEYYGTNYNQITICSNGWVALGSWHTSITTGSVPNRSSPNNTLAIMWCDLNPSRSDTGQVYYKEFDDKFVVSYIRVPEYLHYSTFETFQLILNFARKEIIYQYLDVTRLNGHTANIGWENSAGDDGIRICSWGPSGTCLHDSLAIRIRAVPTATPPYFTDFEDFNGDFSGDTGWEWGVPAMTSPIFPPHSSIKCWATILSGNYANNADWVLNAPHIDATNVDWPIIDFWHIYSTQTGHDGGVIEISTDDGATWIIVEPEGGYPTMMTSGPLAGERAFSGSISRWEYISVNLQPYAHNEILLRFRFVSDATVNDKGWYIDDFGYHEAYGVIKGNIDLRYFDNDSGAHVEIIDLGKEAVTDSLGNFFIDSVVTGVHFIKLWRPRFVPKDSIRVEIHRFDTLIFIDTLNPELYFADFAEDNGDMVADPVDGWQWGRPLAGPDSAYSDSFCWGTNLSGNYANNADWKLTVQIPLYGVEYPVLSFYHWYKFNGEFAGILLDGGNVKISLDSGATWQLMYPVEGYDGVVGGHNPILGGQPAWGGEGTGDYWHKATIPIYAARGHESVLIRFELGSDRYGTHKGWYIDDVRLAENPEYREWYDSIYGISEQKLKAKKPFIGIYPNPFNSACYIKVYVAEPGGEVKICDIAGHIVDRLGELSTAGTHEFVWRPDEKGIPSGVYVIKVTGNSSATAKRVIFVK